MLNFIPGWPQLKLILMALVIIGSFAGGWKVEGWRWSASQVAVVEATQEATHEQAVEDNKASAALETQQEHLRVDTTVITKYVDRVVQKPVYRNVCLDADGLRAVNSAIAGTSPTPSQPDGTVPAPVTP